MFSSFSLCICFFHSRCVSFFPSLLLLPPPKPSILSSPTPQNHPLPPPLPPSNHAHAQQSCALVCVPVRSSWTLCDAGGPSSPLLRSGAHKTRGGPSKKRHPSCLDPTNDTVNGKKHNLCLSTTNWLTKTSYCDCLVLCCVVFFHSLCLSNLLFSCCWQSCSFLNSFFSKYYNLVRITKDFTFLTYYFLLQSC